jgi:hypothetical protein
MGNNNNGGARNPRTGNQDGVEVVLLPTIRQREVRFRAQGLLPNTRHYPFFDGVRVDKYCYPLPFELGDNWRFAFRNNWDANNRVPSELAPVYSAIYEPLVPEDWNNTWNPLFGDTEPDPDSPSFQALVSDANGKIDGVFFIPNNDEVVFDAGVRTFSLYDITLEDDNASASRARTEYTAQGRRETSTVTIVLPPPPPDGVRDDGNNGGDNVIDPIAQTFFVNNNTGTFITKVGVFFASKDTGNIPIELQIRPTVNGYPSANEVLPGSNIFLNPDDVTVSDDASAETIFQLDHPVFLEAGGEYAIVLRTTSFDYNVWISRMGEFALGETDRKITTQPSLGSLFKSQNSTTWEPTQLEDLKFSLYRAKFATSGNAIIENEGTSQRLLPGDPFLFDSGDATVRVIHPNHGFVVNDETSLRFDSDLTWPVLPKSISGNRTITAVDATGYTFEADSAASTGGRFGGTSVKAKDQVVMDFMIPSIDIASLSGTSSSMYGKFTTGKSLAGIETPYGKDTTFSDEIKPFERTFFNAPKLIATRSKEVAELAGAKSVTFQVNMNTTTDFLSPVIDADRMSLTAINNIIDNQDSSATSGFNVPLTFVDEADPTLGSSVAKYVTRPVTLAEDAVGLKIILAANKPNEASFDVYYKAIDENAQLSETNWTLVEPETTQPDATSPNVFYEYRYLVGGLTGTMTPFTTFQVKIVMRSTNSSRPPSFKDLRVLALTV